MKTRISNVINVEWIFTFLPEFILIKKFFPTDHNFTHCQGVPDLNEKRSPDFGQIKRTSTTLIS